MPGAKHGTSLSRGGFTRGLLSAAEQAHVMQAFGGDGSVAEVLGLIGDETGVAPILRRVRLERDLGNLCRDFARYGVRRNAEAIARDLWSRYLRGTLTAP